MEQTPTRRPRHIARNVTALAAGLLAGGFTYSDTGSVGKAIGWGLVAAGICWVGMAIRGW